MIVDLLRNDLSRVCTIDSVRVTPTLWNLEQYEFVQHLVSAVCGGAACRVQPARSGSGGLFRAARSPGRSEVRAMEIIAELEPTARGPYCGALGYLGFDARSTPAS